MKAFAGNDGKLYVLYRGVQEKLNRPELCLVSDDAGHTFKPLYTDLWKTATCPAIRYLSNSIMRIYWRHGKRTGMSLQQPFTMGAKPI